MMPATRRTREDVCASQQLKVRGMGKTNDECKADEKVIRSAVLEVNCAIVGGRDAVVDQAVGNLYDDAI